jgi:hypothetical protein
MGLVFDDLKKDMSIRGKGGKVFLMKPGNQNINIDYTTPSGGCSNLYYSLIFQMPKWGYYMAKVDEYMSVTPMHAEAYRLTITQKQTLEGSIKAGMASVAQAVSDYELIAHDYRRYKEIYDYFMEGETDEHVLRSLFVDRVDSFTGENYSLVTMARRWPTIITDFIRMKDEDEVNVIRKDLDVSAAEATILKTKNQLYKEWKTMFRPVVEERLARLKVLMDSRKRSVQEYRSWLKPYVSRFKMMKDSLEEAPAKERTSRFMTLGFSQAVASAGIRLWAWKPFVPEERGRPEGAIDRGKSDFVVEPYDDFVKDKLKLINERYGVKITDKMVNEIKKDAIEGQMPHVPKMDPNELYYHFYDITLDRSIIRTTQPEGGEVEDMMFYPLETWVMSQNVVLLLLIELKAIELSFEKEINEIIGIHHDEGSIIREAREEYEKRTGKTKPVKKSGVKDFVEGVRCVKRGVVGAVQPFSKYFFKQGPYESIFKERVTKIYLVGSGQKYGEFLNWIKGKMGVS